MSKLIITLPDEMHVALNEMAAKEDKVVAAIVRRLISEYLAERGVQIDPTMRWGSGRRSESDTNKE